VQPRQGEGDAGRRSGRRLKFSLLDGAVGNRRPGAAFQARSAVAIEGRVVSTKDESGPSAPPGKPPHPDYDARPIPDRVLAMLLAALVVALVLGYLFVNKMVDISRQEDCALSSRRNCAPVELPNR
jgi:hypothetical protein